MGLNSLNGSSGNFPSHMTEFHYVGSELSIFEKALNWKAYIRHEIGPYVKGDVLEVGAGSGTNTRIFEKLPFASWTCLEPDRMLLTGLKARLPQLQRYELIAGTTSDVHTSRRFDTILYIDVLEHIRDDHAEVHRAASLLKLGGALVVLAPAHQWLFSPFDQAIGHYRRYTKSSLAAVIPPCLRQETLFYVDSVGLLASIGNKLLLRNPLPTASQILVWDGILIRCSRIADRLLLRRVGKSVVGVWRLEAGTRQRSGLMTKKPRPAGT